MQEVLTLTNEDLIKEIKAEKKPRITASPVRSTSEARETAKVTNEQRENKEKADKSQCALRTQIL